MNSPNYIFLNGEFLPRIQASMDIEDRGTMFGDGVYEVLRYYNGKPFEFDRHLERLRRSLTGVEISEPPDIERLREIGTRLVELNGTPEGKVYWQITRGAAPRDHAVPAGIEPTLLVIVYPDEPSDPSELPGGLTAVLAPDERWHHCWIKSIMLLPNVLALRKAQQMGAGAAILHRGGLVTEATSANVFIIREGVVLTHPADQWILDGVTRTVLIESARKEGIDVREEPFRTGDLLQAQEVFITGTTINVTPIIRVDEWDISDGTAGPMTRRLHHILAQRICSECGL